MKKNGKMAVSALIFTGIGIGAWMMYKKNPNIICDMKVKVKDMAGTFADKLDDMNMD